MERVYIVDAPSAPREPAGQRVWPSGVVRTVTHVGETNVVSWDFSNDKHAA